MIIVYCLDTAYVQMAEISIATVKKYNPNALVIVVSEKELKVKGADGYYTWPLHRKCRHKIGADRISDAAYLKLMLPDILPYDKVIFIDGDVECKSPLNELWDMPCEYINLCPSHNYGKEQAKELGLSRYGLSGMMVMNLKALREIGLAELCLKVEQTLPTPRTGWCHEETCINVALHDKLSFLPIEWNYCRKRDYDHPVRWDVIRLLHYVGGKNKPFMMKLPLYHTVQPILDDIRGKRVAIVGNAKSLFSSQNGQEIDNADFVIRFNKGFISKPETQGTKTNLVMLACDLTDKEISSYNTKWVVNRSRFYHNPKAQYTISTPDREQLREILDCQPSTGFMAVDLCLMAGAKSITLFGFDGEETPTFYNPEGYITKHDYKRESKLLRRYELNGLIERRK